MPQRRKHIRLNDLVQMRMLKNANNVKNVGIMLEIGEYVGIMLKYGNKVNIMGTMLKLWEYC